LYTALEANFVLEWRLFTAQQIADAFANFISGHIDWPIKQDALESWYWHELELGDGSEGLICEFDLVPLWDIINDFLFLGSLKNVCSVKWVDPGFLGKAVGRLEINNATRGPPAWVYVQRRTPMVPCTV
jgi:hypothetical protein